MNNKKSWIFTAILCGVATLLQAQMSESFTLDQAVQYALQNNSTVKNAQLDVNNTRFRAWEIKSMGLPQVEAGLDYNYYYLKPVTQGASSLFSGGVFGDLFSSVAKTDPSFAQKLLAQQYSTTNERVSFVLPHSTTAQITLSQLIFDGRYFLGIKAIKDLTSVQYKLKDKSDFDVKYDVAKAYANAAGATEAVAQLERLLPLIDKLLSDTRATYKEGLIEELDVERIELVKSNIVSQITLAKQKKELAISHLKIQMGYPFSANLVLAETFENIYDSEFLKPLSNYAVENRIEYDLLNTQLRLKELDIKQRRSGYYPTLVGFVNFGFSGQTDKFKYLFKNKQETLPAIPGLYPETTKTTQTWWSQGLVGLKLIVPVFDGGRKWASINQAKIEKQKIQNDLDNFKNASQLQVAYNQSNYDASLVEKENTERAFDLSKKIMNKTSIKFREGIGNSFEFTQAQQEFVSAQIKQIQAKINVINAKLDLEKSLGIK